MIKAHTGGVRSVAFSPDGSSLLSASDDKTIKLWSLAGQKFKQTLTGHSNWVRAARFAPAGDLVVSAGDDKTVRLWDLHNKQMIHTFYDHTAPVNDCCFHPDGLCVAACSSDNTIKIWDTRMNQLLQHYSAHLSAVNSIAIHPSGDYLMSGSSDMTTKIWDLREGHLCYTLHGHKAAVNSVAYSPDGDYFATGSSGNFITTPNMLPFKIARLVAYTLFGSIDDAAVPSGKLTAPLVKNNLQTLASNPPPSLVHADSILNSLLTRLLLSLSIPLLLQTLSFSSGRRISTSRRWLTCAATSLWTRAHTRYSALLRKRKEAASPYPPRQSRLPRLLPLLAGGSSTTTTTTASRRATASMALAAGDHPLPHPSNKKNEPAPGKLFDDSPLGCMV